MRSAVQSTTSLQTQVLIQVLLMWKSMVLLTWGLK